MTGMTRASEIVRHAVQRSGGFGEPWCCGFDRWPDAVRVGDWLFVVETDCDSFGTPAALGWLVMVYRVPDEGGAAELVGVLAEDNDDAVRALTSLIHEAERPMTWIREKPGLYRSRDYLVGHLDTGEWFAEGPGVDRCFDHKAEAQAACDSARRTAWPGPP